MLLPRRYIVCGVLQGTPSGHLQLVDDTGCIGFVCDDSVCFLTCSPTSLRVFQKPATVCENSVVLAEQFHLLYERILLPFNDSDSSTLWVLLHRHILSHTTQVMVEPVWRKTWTRVVFDILSLCTIRYLLSCPKAIHESFSRAHHKAVTGGP